MTDTQELVDRYTAIWNEPDAGRRRDAVAELWSRDAVQVLQPPEEVREAAGALAVTATLQARGHAELEARVGRAYEQFVAQEGNSFRPRGDGDRLGAVVKFRWEMVSGEGEVTAVGLEILVLDPQGLIETDYQFIES